MSSLCLPFDAALAPKLTKCPSELAESVKHLQLVEAIPPLPNLASTLVNLQSLTVSVTDAPDEKTVLHFVAAIAKSLTAFTMEFCGALRGAPVLRALATNHSILQSLVLRFAPAVDPHSVDALLRKCGQSLKVFEMDSCGSVNDDVLFSVAKHCTVLERLCVGGCMVVGDDGVIAITESKCASTLRALDIRACMNVTDEAIEQIALTCRQLTYLNIWHVCVTSFGVRAIAEGLGERLTTLVIGDCIGIDDTALESIADNCDSLTTLEICGLRKITDVGVMSLFNCARFGKLQLTALTIDRCPLISDKSVLAALGFAQVPCRNERAEEQYYGCNKTNCILNYSSDECVCGSSTCERQASRYEWHESHITRLSANDCAISQATWAFIRERRKNVQINVDDDCRSDSAPCCGENSDRDYRNRYEASSPKTEFGLHHRTSPACVILD